MAADQSSELEIAWKQVYEQGAANLVEEESPPERLIRLDSQTSSARQSTFFFTAFLFALVMERAVYGLSHLTEYVGSATHQTGQGIFGDSWRRYLGRSVGSLAFGRVAVVVTMVSV